MENEPFPPSTGSSCVESGAPKISVIIPHYNDLEQLRLCLDCLSVQTMDLAQYEIIVSDNNSAFGLDAVRAACGKLARVVPAPRFGAAEARNVGAANARGEVLAFTDSDCRPAPDWLKRGVEALGDADIVGGRVAVAVEKRTLITSAEAFELVFAFKNHYYVERQGYSVTANMFTTKAVFERVGDFRAGVPEDLDWGRRAIRRGFRIRYNEGVIVSHPARSRWVELEKKWRRTTMEAYLLACEQPHGKVIWFARSWLILASPFLHLPSVFMSKELLSLPQRFGALSVLFRLRLWRFLECNRLLLTL